MFRVDSRLLQVGEPSGVTVSAGGEFLGLVIILVSLLVSEMDWQLLINECQFSRLAFLTALL